MKTFLVCWICICIWDASFAQRLDLPIDSVSSAIKKLDFYLKEVGKDSIDPENATDFTAEELPEVLIYKNNAINAVALGIIPHEVEPLTLNEKRVLTAGTFKPIDLLKIVAGGMPLDPVINVISGRTKKLKKIVAVERKALNVDFLKEEYSGYILRNFRVAETDFGKFLYFMADDPECTQTLETKDKNKIEFFIAENWTAFQAEK